eukprot:symbB.v1.2.031771.t1/scaffold3680.1/size54306/1
MPLLAIEPLLVDAFLQDSKAPNEPPRKTPGESTESHRALAAKIILDVVSADRTVPLWVLKGVIKATGAPWQSGAQGEELRATLLLQLLRNSGNAEAAAASPEVCQYLSRPGLKKKEDTAWPVKAWKGLYKALVYEHSNFNTFNGGLFLCCPRKAYLLSGETHDLLRRGARLVGKHRAEAIEPQPKRERDTPSLQIKRDLRNLWTTILLTAGWAAMQHFSGAGVSRIPTQATLQLAAGIAGALAGTTVLESLWRLEEMLIESEYYWEDVYGTVPASMAMMLANCISLAWAARFSCIVPFVFCRLFKDDYLDAHRTFE